MEKLRELTKEELKGYSKSGYLTVGELKRFLNEHELSDNAIVAIQRIEDVYYEKHNWGVYLKRGEHTFNVEQWNRDIESGKFLDKEKYPNMKEETLVPATEEEIKKTMEQYHPAWCCVNYKEDKDILFIDLHY